MRVDQQINSDRLLCTHSWGSKGIKKSGTYAYITCFYNLEFSGFNQHPSNHFSTICNRALTQIKQLKEEQGENFEYAFDHILIDESQDFPESFFELCEAVCKNDIFIAGDIFQDIFSQTDEDNQPTDYLLSKCYRTDPKTLMFAHALSMGLFEPKPLRWLEDKQWEKCGYQFTKLDNTYEFTREPVRRFEDLNNNHANSNNLQFINFSHENIAIEVINIIKQIKFDHPTVQPDDIAVLFLDSLNASYEARAVLKVKLRNDSDLSQWPINDAISTKKKIQGQIFISNKNNVKGLEFPFVICITELLNSVRSYRNSLYMLLTRSFIKSYLLMSNKGTALDTQKILLDKIEEINNTSVLKVTKPNEISEEAPIQHDGTETASTYDLINQILDSLEIYDSLVRDKIQDEMSKREYYEDADLLKATIISYARKEFGNLL